jgi:hypothetical protein
MAKPKKKRNKKYNPLKSVRQALIKRNIEVNINEYLEPVQTFINQVKTDDVYVDQNDNALMSLPGLDVEELARSGQQPYSAVYNLRIFGEVTYQTVLYTQTDDHYIRSMIKIINAFDKQFVEPLRLKEPMNMQGVEAAQAYVNACNLLLKSIHVKDFHTVLQHIIMAVEQPREIVTNHDMRDWLIDYFFKIKSKKIHYLVKFDHETTQAPQS